MKKNRRITVYVLRNSGEGFPLFYSKYPKAVRHQKFYLKMSQEEYPDDNYKIEDFPINTIRVRATPRGLIEWHKDEAQYR